MRRMSNTFYTDDKALAHALAIIESGNDSKARGDLLSPDGPALGAFQIHQKAWDDISAIRRRHAESVHPYHSALDAHIARDYALSFMSEIVYQFREHYGAPPQPRLLYACYSLGPSILPKIKDMKGITLIWSPFEANMASPHPSTQSKPLTSIGYAPAISRRKIATGVRYENLLGAHHQSLRDTGKPILW